VAIATGLERFYNFLANMGLVLRDDPPKVIDMAGRAWGEAVNGFALSIREIPKEDPRQQAVLSVVIRNAGTEPKNPKHSWSPAGCSSMRSGLARRSPHMGASY
jgi:hypothetical protein